MLFVINIKIGDKIRLNTTAKNLFNKLTTYGNYYFDECTIVDNIIDDEIVEFKTDGKTRHLHINFIEKAN